MPSIQTLQMCDEKETDPNSIQFLEFMFIFYLFIYLVSSEVLKIFFKIIPPQGYKKAT